MPPEKEESLADAIRYLAEIHEGRFGEIADALKSVASAIRALGNANAATPMGAIEALGLTLKESVGELAESVSQIAEKLDGRSEGE